MKKKIFIITCLAVMISMVLGPLQMVMSATSRWPSPGVGYAGGISYTGHRNVH